MRDHYKYEDTLVEVHSLSLLQSVDIGSTKSHFMLHPLVVDWLKLRIDQKGRQKYAIEAKTMLTNYIITHDQGTLPLYIKHDILSHVDVCLQNDGEYLKGLDESDITSHMTSTHTFAKFYHEHGRYKEVEAM